MASQAAAKRVVTLLNAISDLHEGDLDTVLYLDAASWWDPKFQETEALEYHGNLGQLLEDHLVKVMVYGEVELDSDPKRRRAKKALGGRHWS